MAPIIRILMRYGIGALVTYGYLSADDGGSISADPDIQFVAEMLLGAAAAALNEAWYAVAKKWGWAT